MLDVREPIGIRDGTQAARTRGARLRQGRKGGEERSAKAKGLKIDCMFSRKGVSPFDEIEWDRRRASISDDKGNVIFAQDDVEVPKSWSMLATNIVASKYFFGPPGTDKREKSVRQLVHRVSRTIADWGLNAGYFATPEDAEAFYGELTALCVNQYGSFNSPVWFNVGLYHVNGHSSASKSSYCWSEEEQQIVPALNSYKTPQASACFIQAVEDTLEDIMRLAASEALLFKFGSGTGTDLSTLRSSREKLSGGGIPSGPLSFMRVFDQVAAVVKSGGKTRRAAKMQSLKIDHPDILDFIECKMKEEKKAWALIDQGYDGSFGGEAYSSVMFQNANMSVRVYDEFMQAVENGGTWQTKAVRTGEAMDTYNARDLMRKIAEGAHTCGDPGLQYDTTINRWHTCKNSGRINASNPCSEYMFVDDSACNLASLNLMKFSDETGTFDVERFSHAVRIFIIAQDILVDAASYPSSDIASNSHLFRPLGLGYANLGALNMRLGHSYDSEDGRAFAAAVTALMTGCAYQASEEIARAKGPFTKFEENRDCMLEVIRMHQAAVSGIDSAVCAPHLRKAAEQVWKHVAENGPRTGFRNAQVTVLAPTGTIGFMMDCDTTGVEPDIALVKYKQLAGGGSMKLVNQSLRPALLSLGYKHEDAEAIVKYVDEHEMIEGAPQLKAEHLPVFDCAFKPKNGKRFISYKAHLRMMGAVQPFLSGAISKTVNMPPDATVNEIMQTYIDGWKLGLKAVAIYRDGSKRTQPLNTSKVVDKVSVKALEAAAPAPEPTRRPFRRRMPTTRQSLTHKFEIAGHEGYLTVGIYEDGSPGELFITMAKEGSTVGGTMDSFGTAISLCLQYGVPVNELCRKFAHSRFEPSGFTRNPEIPNAKSIIDYIFRWLELTFPGGKCRTMVSPAAQDAEGVTTVVMSPVLELEASKSKPDRTENQFNHFMEDAPACDVCGTITVRNGACYRCHNCGNSMGCS
jgi:ribonucleoside-diphosphate reductase alpha chain